MTRLKKSQKTKKFEREHAKYVVKAAKVIAKLNPKLNLLGLDAFLMLNTGVPFSKGTLEKVYKIYKLEIKRGKK